jgi:hypothetical protein
MAGKKGRCPGCKAVVEIPTSSSKPTPQPAAPPALAPLASAPTQPALQPLGPTPGLQPLGDLSGLQPLDGGLPGLQPLGGPSPLGPTADPFAALGPATANPFGDAAFGSAIPNPLAGSTTLAPNPYSSPSTVSYKPSKELDDPRQRRGFPWQREQDFEAFSETAKRVLFGFPTAFQHMRVEGGIGSALGFIVSAQIAATVINSCYFLLLKLVILLFAAGNGADQAGGAIVGALITFGMEVIFGTMGAAIGAIIGSFIMGGIFHLCLLVAGAANRGFDTTYQVLCYASGACALLVVVPILGWIIQPFLFPVVLIFGFMHAHGTSGLRATFAVLLPYLLCFAAMAFLIFSIIAVVAGNMPPQ